MIKQRYQKVFDSVKGDCFATCVAMILDLNQDDVPNFCLEEEDWWRKFQNWLGKYRLTAIEIDITRTGLSTVLPDIPCILTGKSPRGDWLHSVVGFTSTQDNIHGFEFAFDPNPRGGFIEGEIQLVLFFASLRPDLVRKP